MANLVRYWLRRNTNAMWALENPIVPDGDIAYSTDEPRSFRVGDGMHQWSELPEVGGGGSGGGADGLSAYELAVEEGFVGDLAAWLASLQGEDGPPGSEGPPGSSGLVKVTHGSDPNVARPVGAPVVYWVGSVVPVNADPDDFLKEV